MGLIHLALLGCWTGADTDADGAPDRFDCAPNDATRYPGNDEQCNGHDDDCDDGTAETGANLDGHAFQTLGGALAEAKEGDTVHVCAGTYDANLLIDQDLTLESYGGEDVTVLDGGGHGSVIRMQDGASLTLRGFTLQNGTGTAASDGVHDGVSGGGVYGGTVGDLLLEHVTFTGNTADYGGGVRVTEAASLTLHNATFTDNVATVAGGAVDADGLGDLYVADSRFEGNTAARGFAIAAQDVAGTCAMLRVEMLDNTGVGADELWGGAAYLEADCVLTDSLVEGNTAPDAVGGGLVAVGHTLALVGTPVRGNVAAYGGGVALGTTELGDVGLVTDDGSPIEGNAVHYGNVDPLGTGADAWGGGVAVFNWTSARAVHLTGLTVTDNAADGSGGGIVYADQSLGGVIEIDMATVVGNTVDWGMGAGVVFLNTGVSSKGGANVVLSDSTLQLNLGGPGSMGGGLAAYQIAALTLDDVTVDSNEAVSGAGLSIEGVPTVLMQDTMITSNVSSFLGGGVLYTPRVGELGMPMPSTFELVDSYVGWNWASGQGGGVRTDGVVTLTRTVLEGNSGTIGGGVFLADDFPGHPTGVTGDGISEIRGCAGHWGAGIGMVPAGGGGFRIQGVRLVENLAAYGGGLAIWDTWPGQCSSLTVEDAVLDANYGDAGGAIYAGCPVTVRDSSVTANDAVQGGGAWVDGLGTLASEDSDWGAYDLDNSPEDVWVGGHRWGHLGATFTCDPGTGVCEP